MKIEPQRYSIPIYKNGEKTPYTIDGIVNDSKYLILLRLGNGKTLPDKVDSFIENEGMNDDSLNFPPFSEG